MLLNPPPFRKMIENALRPAVPSVWNTHKSPYRCLTLSSHRPKVIMDAEVIDPVLDNVSTNFTNLGTKVPNFSI